MLSEQKPKVLLDISLLGHDPSVWRGMERVAKNLFDGLRAVNQCDLSFVSTSHLVGAHDFLAAQEGSLETALRRRPGQLQLSRLGSRLSKIVHRSIANRSLPARAGRRTLAQVVQACSAGESRLTPAMLRHTDIYHSPYLPFPKAVRAAARLRKFVTVYDFNPLKYPQFFSGRDTQYINGLKACLTRDNFAFSISETVRNDILEFCAIPPERIFLTPLAADHRTFYPETDPQRIAESRARHGIPEGPYFLSLSAHSPQKNFAHLIHCFGALVESGELTDTSLVLVGPNPQRNPEVRQTLEQYPRAQSRVIITGLVPDVQLAAVYSGATAFLFPSFCEGFGIPPLEAMQCGTPVIASNATAIPEVVGDAGILLPPTDKEAWCQAMLQLARQSNLRAELRKKSLARAALFTWERFIQQTLYGYKSSLTIA